MSAKIVLVIDDSATIRKVVDSNLSPIGYHVVLAPNAEDGLELAPQVNPDVILLDHQLPGTTGFEVCQQLASMPEVRHVPVVISSTLRNRAYAEYTELPNVVDMLPKPYTSDLLITTVSNALETGALIVQSQSEGTAVPEVINEVGETELQGALGAFGLREIIDFLNNGEKRGTLEVEAGHTRTWIHLERGRIQGVTANAVDEQELLQFLPEALRQLAPVLNLTSSAGAGGSQVDGLVQLLDRKVLDPRLLGKLLRCHAAFLLFRCFKMKLDRFQFEATSETPSLTKRLPLDLSLMSLLVDGAMHSDLGALPVDEDGFVYSRRAIRGQNLDRAGMSARHMKLLGQLSEPRSTIELAQSVGWEPEEVRRVIAGLSLAELVDRETKTQQRSLLVIETEPGAARQIKSLLEESLDGYSGKVVRDRLALQLVLRRMSPDVVLFAADEEASRQLAVDLFQLGDERLNAAKWVAITSSDSQWSERESLPFVPAQLVSRPLSSEQLTAALQAAIEGREPSEVAVLQ